MTRLGSAIPARRTKHAQDFGSLALTFLVTIDVEGFSQLHAAEQARVQDDLEHAMTKAAANAGWIANGGIASRGVTGNSLGYPTV